MGLPDVFRRTPVDAVQEEVEEEVEEEEEEEEEEDVVVERFICD